MLVILTPPPPPPTPPGSRQLVHADGSTTSTRKSVAGESTLTPTRTVVLTFTHTNLKFYMTTIY